MKEFLFMIYELQFFEVSRMQKKKDFFSMKLQFKGHLDLTLHGHKLLQRSSKLDLKTSGQG